VEKRYFQAMLQYLTGFLLSILASTLLTWCVRNIARRRGMVRAPESGRHIHTGPIPRLGGVAVFLTFTLLLLACSFLSPKAWLPDGSSGQLLRIAAIGAALFAVGLIDDLYGLLAWPKLAVQIAAAVGLYYSGIRFNFCGTHFAGSYTWLICLGLTVTWVVLICNAINLIDGLDGLAAGAALFSMVTIFSLALGNRSDIALATAILGGSVFGFLVLNFNPASIFLGDSGSLFVGFILSAFVLAESQKQATTLDNILVPAVAFALPLTDVGLSILRRFLSGSALFGADREHIHHKLLELGLTQRQVVWVLYGISAMCAVLSLFLLKPYDVALIPVGAIMLITLFFGLRKLNYHEFGEFERVGKRIGKQRAVCARNIALRKAAFAIQNAANCQEIAQLLQGSLVEDFDGFKIVVSDKFGRPGQLPSPWQVRSMGATWNESRDKIVYTLDLGTDTGQEIGTLSLFQSGDRDLLIDNDLMKGEFRRAVAFALQKTIGIQRPPFAPAPDALDQPVLKPGLARYIEREV
jgi:UDP-GlcNAc:undecaprenyl-phosphate/decaprenyl-phosphate GlcNAc-1-phosphate transferase